jgi:hypothetical protein
LKKILLLSFLASSTFCFAQKRNTQFSIAAESAVMATQQAYKVYNLGFGGSGKILFPTDKRDFITGTLEVMAFSGRSGPISEIFQISSSSSIQLPSNINVAHPSLTLIVPKIGYKHFLNTKLNAEVEAGYTFASVKKLDTNIKGDVGGICFSFGMGFLVAKKLDIGLRYEQFVTTASEKDYTSFVALRTLLMIDWKK